MGPDRKPDNSEGTQTKNPKMGHSGKLPRNAGGERPPRHGIFHRRDRFDKTELNPDMVNPLLDHAGSLLPWHRKKGVRIGVVAAGFTLAAASIWNIIDSDKERLSQVESTRVENKSTEEENESIVESLDFQLSKEDYQVDPEQIIIDFVNQFNEWQNTGVLPGSASAEERFQVSDEQYAVSLNEESDRRFIENMLVADWQTNPRLVEWVEDSMNVHITNSWGALMTTNTGGTEESEPYKRYIDIDLNSVKVQNTSTDEIVVSATWAGRDNSGENNIEDIRTGGIDPNQEVGGYTLRFVSDSRGNMLLADVVPFSG